MLFQGLFYNEISHVEEMNLQRFDSSNNLNSYIMGEERKDEYYSDPWVGKKAGETYNEAQQRQMKEYNEAMERVGSEQRAQTAEKLKRQQETLDGIARARGSERTSSRPYSRSSVARVMLWVGWLALFAGLGYMPGESSKILFQGIPLYQLMLGIGVICLGLVYFHKFVNLVIFMFTSWLFYTSGQTDDGFKFTAVPFKIWAICIVLGLVMFGFLFLFERRR